MLSCGRKEYFRLLGGKEIDLIPDPLHLDEAPRVFGRVIGHQAVLAGMVEDHPDGDRNVLDRPCGKA